MYQVNEPKSDKYGGDWTIKKLDILERYLDAYTTALKDQYFKLIYIDAFAGTGQLSLKDPGKEQFIAGSATRAINIKDKPFDQLIFVEKNRKRCAELITLKEQHPNRNISIKNEEANIFLANFQNDWKKWRGVLFLDPFATEVEWKTIEKIAELNALDTWILFPVSAIARMLVILQTPGESDPKWPEVLTRIFGDDTWNNLYRISTQQDLFKKEQHERNTGVADIIKIYKDKLSDLFGDRFLDVSRTLRTSTNSPLFEFLFCAGNPRGAKIAKKIAKHILDNL